MINIRFPGPGSRSPKILFDELSEVWLHLVGTTLAGLFSSSGLKKLSIIARYWLLSFLKLFHIILSGWIWCSAIFLGFGVSLLCCLLYHWPYRSLYVVFYAQFLKTATILNGHLCIIGFYLMNVESCMGEDVTCVKFFPKTAQTSTNAKNVAW